MRVPLRRSRRLVLHFHLFFPSSSSSSEFQVTTGALSRAEQRYYLFETRQQPPIGVLWACTVGLFSSPFFFFVSFFFFPLRIPIIIITPSSLSSTTFSNHLLLSIRSIAEFLRRSCWLSYVCRQCATTASISFLFLSILISSHERPTRRFVFLFFVFPPHLSGVGFLFFRARAFCLYPPLLAGLSRHFFFCSSYQ